MKNPKNKNKSSTQKLLPFSEIRNNCLIMKDGTLRMVIMVSSINFALKSEEEQNAIISAYMQFLNSMKYPIQIVVQSRKMNIDPYLQRLEKSEKEQVNELLKIQIADYRKYIQELVELGSIMSKKFYIVVPYDPLSDEKKSFFNRLSEIFTPTSFINLSDKKFEARKKELIQRTEHAISSLSSIGLRAKSLNTQQLIELFYNSYNPDLLETEKIKEIDKVQVEEHY